MALGTVWEYEIFCSSFGDCCPCSRWEESATTTPSSTTCQAHRVLSRDHERLVHFFAITGRMGLKYKKKIIGFGIHVGWMTSKLKVLKWWWDGNSLNMNTHEKLRKFTRYNLMNLIVVSFDRYDLIEIS